MTIRKLVSEVLKVGVSSRRLSELAHNAKGQGVAADSCQMFSQQVGGSLGVASGCGADNFDVVAFPVHLLTAGAFFDSSGECIEIRHGDTEVPVGPHGTPQCRGSLMVVCRSLRLPVPRGCLLVGAEGAAVILNGWPNRGEVVMGSVRIVVWWLHLCQGARTA